MKFQLLLIFMLFSIVGVFAQQDSVKLKNGYFFGVGIAVGTGSQNGVYVMAHIQVQHSTSYLALKGSSFVVLDILGDEPTPSVSDVSLIVGKSYTFGGIHNFQIGSGLSSVTIVSRGALLPCKSCGWFESNKYETITKNVIGLPIEAKYNLYSYRRRGTISFSLNANLNKEQSYFGAAIGLIAGRLR
ncbi:hypothetical protein GM921_13030 [Pedobacter sp. LMG 31464]|uniref:Uncharacterized protein n=1 Tax=Pedobacter planticolens TaxID=2679964 RepID=A0A923E1M6_9SPHI|nr:hypothetical protein [Pedobacter planticolens]MBB2146418.1 hypothetical protein [Pedobacter planticolens]